MDTNWLARRILYILSTVGFLTLPTGCGNDFVSGTPGTSSTSGTAKMTVRLVDAPIADYKEININIQEVQIHRADNDTGNDTESGTWITLAKPNRTVNLLDLTGGVSATLADNVTIPAGQYGQMRLILGDSNTVKLADDSVHDLKVPSGMHSGIKLTVHFTVDSGTAKDVFIDFDAARSIMLHKAGNSQKYILRPTVRAFDKLMTGSISGTFTDNVTGAPRAGAIVTAQVLDNASDTSIVRSTTTATNGSYLLDLLPIGGTFYVVSQPVIGTTVYEARTSNAISLSGDNATAVYNAAFTAVTSIGSIAGTITPTADEDPGDTVSLIQTISVDGGAYGFVVQTGVPVVTGTAETYAFTTVPAGSYTVKAVRATQNSDGTITYQNSLTAPVVTADPATPATADLQF